MKHKGNLPPSTPIEAKRIVDLIDSATVRFEGQIEEIEQAIGMYFLGRSLGWKVLILVHNKRTVRKFQEILGIDIREEFPELGPDAQRSRGFRIASALSNFWKAVSGDTKIEDRRLID